MIKFYFRLLSLSLTFCLLTFSLACKKPVTTPYTDVDAIQDYINMHPSLFSADVYDTLRVSPFYREITGKENWIRINFHWTDSVYQMKTADVDWEDTLRGVFHTFISGTEYRKNFKAFSRVRAYFEQWGRSGDIYRGWLLMKISNMPIYSVPLPSVGFSNLQIYTSADTIPISLSGAPDELKKILQLNRLSTIKFSLQASNPNDFFYLHIYDENGWRKIRFSNDSANVLTATWTPTSLDFDAYRHAYIDCVKYRTATDSTYNIYDSRTWAILYKVK